MEGRTWQSTTIFNASWWIRPGQLLGQDSLPICHMQHGVTRGEKWSYDVSCKPGPVPAGGDTQP